jgi:hypothetical protein
MFQQLNSFLLHPFVCDGNLEQSTNIKFLAKSSEAAKMFMEMKQRLVPNYLTGIKILMVDP